MLSSPALPVCIKHALIPFGTTFEFVVGACWWVPIVTCGIRLALLLLNSLLLSYW